MPPGQGRAKSLYGHRENKKRSDVMSTQTEHIGLHQWESTDPFLREDFNGDNSKIDQAVGEVRE